MNNGKICVSVCAETADEFIEKIKRAAEIADVIELRFDSLKKEDFCYNQLEKAEKVHNRIYNEILNLNFASNTIQTFRPSHQGGFRDVSKKERTEFWNSGCDGTGADVEEDIAEEVLAWLYEPRICSHHDFEETPVNLIKLFESVQKTVLTTDIVKIAVQTIEITDSLSVWKLLKNAESENKELIPIAMGEAGKWTRILGLAFGSPITYASLESGNETAPGQISAKDLIEVYRVKELNEQTEIYGIIGNPVSHSLSPYMHNAAFKHHNLNAVYIPFEVQSLDEFIKRMVRPETREIDWNLKGFSVTIPHKEAIMKHLDVIDIDAERIGAVNTVKIIDGKLHGFNTDADGFIEPLRNSYGDLKDANVGIIGNGGATRACVYALKKDDANVMVFGRTVEKARKLANHFKVESCEFKYGENNFSDLDILVNTTPLGMKDSFENQTPATAEQIKNLHIVYDLVYNPLETLFLREAKSVDVPTIGGLAMLVAQGMKQFEIWTDLDAPMQVMSRAALQRLK